MIKVEELEKELKAEKLNSMYLLYGEETFLLETSLKKIKKLFGETLKGINYITLDETNIDSLISNIETPAFGYEKKLIIARNTCLFKAEGKRKNTEMTKIKEKINTYIKENISIVNQSVVLVFVEKEVDTRLALFKTMDKNGLVCKFEFLKPQQIAKRLKAICKAYEVTIDDGTIMYFIESCGTNMQELINEIRKLIEYTGKNGTITKKEIDLLCTKKMESIIFDLTDSLGTNRNSSNITRKNESSVQILQNLLFAKEPIQKILITIYNHFKKLYFTKLAQRTNRNIAQALKLKPNQMFLVNKYVRQSANFTENQLWQILQKLRDLDYQYKIGLIDVEIGLESILCEYS